MVGQQVFSNLPKGKTVRIVPRTTPSGVFTPDICNALAEPPPIVMGDGKPAVISIDPLTWKPKGDCNTAGSAGTAVDEVLLHEILHSYRQLSGHQRGDAFNVAPDKQ